MQDIIIIMMTWNTQKYLVFIFSQQIAPNIQLTDEELEIRMRMEYKEYVDEEDKFLRELGLKDEQEEPLPSTD